MGSRLGSGGGISVYTLRLVEALADHGVGCDCVVLVSEDALPSWAHRQWPAHVKFVAIRQAETRQPFPARAYRRVRRLLGLVVPQSYGDAYVARQIDGLDLDLIHYPRTVVHPLSILTPCVLTFFDIQHEYYPQFFTESELEWRAQTYRASVEKAQHLIVPSRFTQRTLSEKFNVPECKMSYVPVGLPDSFRRTASEQTEQIRIKYRLPHHFIFYPANPWQHKNHARLMAALRILQDKYGDAPYLVLSGRLPHERRDALSMAIAAGVEHLVIDLEFVPVEDLPALYSAADLLVFPSLFEGFGIPLVEAMACGCPIAVSNATCIPECANGSAFLFDPMDPTDMAAAIYTMLTDQALRERLVSQGYEQLPRFDWRNILPKLLQVYCDTATLQTTHIVRKHNSDALSLPEWPSYSRIR